MTRTVAFSWIFPLEATSGGVERVTSRLMQGLAGRGYDCLFLLHDVAAERFVHDGQPIEDLDAFLSWRGIDTIVNQNGYSSRMTTALGRLGWHGRYLVAHHNEPLYLQKIYNFRRASSEALSGASLRSRLAWSFRVLGYPVWRTWSNRAIGQVQAANYRACDRYVVLSHAFLPELARLIGLPTLPKAIAIPNPLSFEIGAEATGFKKEKEALIVARLNDGEKRISAALKAWQLIEAQDPDGWTLKIVGEGPDAARLRSFADRLGLKRVEFLGRQVPLPHYQSASLFFMTSAIEGWGLTLTEAMQTGCVPIAFDAYASLRDIVDHEKTGLIVPNGDIARFAVAALRLMLDQQFRKGLASDAIAACERYRLDAVLDRWEEIL